MLQNRNLFIATKHKKEEVIQPVFKSNFGINCFVPENFDSDQFGTFSEEIPRILSPIDAAREKCLHVAKVYNADLIISSEGSFGTDPLTGLFKLNEEVLMLMDLENDLEIKVVERTIKTNIAKEEITNVNDLLQFAFKIGFPSHGLILRGKLNGKEKYFKGIVDHRVLLNCFHALKKRTNKITAETDMRAMYNPTRMQVIKRAAVKLVKKIKKRCPKCSTPGFGVENSKPGLPCSNCYMPTKSIKAHIYFCRKCKHKEEMKYPNKIQTEDPMYCDFCNP